MKATVILVHGLWTPAAIFSLHSRWLQQAGYATLFFRYRSVRTTLAQNALELQRFIASQATRDASEIHLVGHSLGGLVILAALAPAADSRGSPGAADPRLKREAFDTRLKREAFDTRLKRVVLLGTPCVDSHCARRMARVAGMPALLGRSIMEWLSRAPGAIALPGLEIGIIAGTRSFGLGRIVPGLAVPNDGVVALAETRLPGAADHLALPLAHSQMLVSRLCADQIAAFLQSGCFRHAPATQEVFTA